VILAMLIRQDGRVIDSKVTQSSGSRELDSGTQLALIQCKHKPGMIDGVPQQSWAKLEYKWALPD
jgi:periplasmic protein TonB